MYNPTHFMQPDQQKLLALINEFPFATLVTQTDEGLDANHLPLVVGENPAGGIVLQGHLARANPAWQQLNSENVLVVFNGPQAYVSPSAYPSKQQNGRVVPTWNYAVVHAAGAIHFIHEADWKLNLLQRLTQQHEAPREQPWAVEDAPEDFTNKLLNAIVGFEIAVNRLEGKWKLSQNQPAENQQGVAADLRASGSPQAVAVADLMRKLNTI